MRVILLLKIPSQLPPAQLAGAFVLHGLSSRQGMEAVQLLTTRDIVVELTGTLQELQATFTKYGFEVQPVPEAPDAEAPTLQALDG